MLRNSAIFRKANDGLLFPPGFVLFGDSGYGLLNWLITPYPSKVIIQDIENYDNILSNQLSIRFLNLLLKHISTSSTHQPEWSLREVLDD
jgi:hypothetical protein